MLFAARPFVQVSAANENTNIWDEFIKFSQGNAFPDQQHAEAEQVDQQAAAAAAMPPAQSSLLEAPLPELPSQLLPSIVPVRADEEEARKAELQRRPIGSMLQCAA